MEETWKPVIGYEGWYSVSNYGNIRRERHENCTKIGKILKQKTNERGYRCVELCKSGKAKEYFIHRLVMDAFNGRKINTKQQTNHKNGIKIDNRPENLEYCTCSENAIHAFKNGLRIPVKGENCYNSKLTNDKVLAIRKEYSAGGITQRSLAKKYNMSHSPISRILRMENWKHV